MRRCNRYWLGPIMGMARPIKVAASRFRASKPRARFLRITITATPPGSWPSLREVKVSGTQAD